MPTWLHNDKASADVYFDIAIGTYANIDHINKFGYTDSIGTSFETVWDGAGIYSYADNATTAAVAGTGADVGATINIQGLDANYNLIDEDVVVGATSTKLFKRVFRARLTVHTDGINANDIDITVDGAVRAKILAGKGQTLMAIYTIPAGYTGYMRRFQGSLEKGKEAVFAIMTRTNGDNVYNTKGQFGSFGVPVTYDYEIPISFTEKTDIEVRAKAGATTGVGAIFDIVLVKD